MYDIKQFKPTLYIVLMLGVTGFCMAAEAWGLWLAAAAGIGLNAWLVYRGRFEPLPRWLANAGTSLAMIYVVARVWQTASPPLMVIGQFLVLLHVIKLFEQRANRDYTQLLVLSLLLMIAASINTASLLFGLLLVAYLAAALYCCLLFHLKCEADRVRSAMDLAPEQLGSSTLRQDQRFFPRSMRRLTALTLVAAVCSAAIIFVFFPRGSGQGLLGQLQFRPDTSMVGFSDHIALDRITRIRLNDEVIAHVFVWRNNKPVAGTGPILLRGLALDTYGRNVQIESRPEWSRSSPSWDTREIDPGYAPGGDLVPRGDVWRQRIVLKPTGTRVLFAMPGLLSYAADELSFPAIWPARAVVIRHFLADHTMELVDPLTVPIEYEVFSSNARYRGDSPATAIRSNRKVLEQVRQEVLRPEVAGDLVAARGAVGEVNDDNERIARRIEEYLHGPEFSYTLDLTPWRREFAEGDPVANFLTKVRMGHCELYASAMTLMCQSVGVPARIVAGFRCDGADYNAVGGYYIVRQSHAHSWVEVLTPRGWTSFDPTSGRIAAAPVRTGLWASVRQIVDYIEYRWAEQVVAYNNADQERLLHSVDMAVINTTYRAQDYLHGLTGGQSFAGIAEQVRFWRVLMHVLLATMGLLSMALVAAIAWFIIERRRLWRRAQRIGLDVLPTDEQLRLARQLAFYDELMKVLARVKVTRPAHKTPREFAASLTFLPHEVYGAIGRLTEIVYKVRYGQRMLDARRQRRLQVEVRNLTMLLIER